MSLGLDFINLRMVWTTISWIMESYYPFHMVDIVPVSSLASLADGKIIEVGSEHLVWTSSLGRGLC